MRPMPGKGQRRGEASDRVTLQTIADALGVSRTTVSNAYNRPDQLNAALRERVLETARRLGYAGPDPAARRLRSGRREAIGLLFKMELSYAFTDPGAVQFLQGLTRATEAAGLSLLLLPSGAAEAVRDAVVSAFCVYSMPDDHDGVAAALERRLPIVIVDEPHVPGVPFVGIDDRYGARLAAEHLTGLGHRRFGVICATHRDRQIGFMDPIEALGGEYEIDRERLAGYREALEAVGVDWTTTPIYEAGHNARELGARAADELLAREPRPTAFLVVADELALGVLQAVRARGLELSVVGFDDIPEAASAGLTTIRQPLLEKGATAGRLLLEGVEPEEVRLPVELVTRSTTGPA